MALAAAGRLAEGQRAGRVRHGRVVGQAEAGKEFFSGHAALFAQGKVGGDVQEERASVRLGAAVAPFGPPVQAVALRGLAARSRAGRRRGGPWRGRIGALCRATS